MEAPEPGAFERAIRRLDPEALTRFVADLWTARARSARIVGPREVAVGGESGSPRRLLICPPLRRLLWDRLKPGRTRLTDVDAVVTNGREVPLDWLVGSFDVCVIDPADLDRIASYGLGATERTSLYRDAFGSPQPAATRGEAEGGFDPVVRVRSAIARAVPFVPQRHVSVRNVAILVWCCLLVVGVGSPQPILSPQADGGSSGTRSLDAADRPAPVPALADGNVSALLVQHRAALADRSAHLVVRLEGTRDTVITDSRWRQGLYRLSTRANGTWRLTVSGRLAPATIGGEPTPVDLAIAADGEACGGESGPPTDSVMRNGSCAVLAADSPVAAASSALLARYLDGEHLAVRSRDRGSAEGFTVVSSTPPPDLGPGVQDYTARAIVTPGGLVRSLTVSYRVPEATGQTRRTFSMRVRNYTARVAD